MTEIITGNQPRRRDDHREEHFKGPSLEDIPDQRIMSLVDPEGQVTTWYGDDSFNLTAARWWRSDLFGFGYPLDWAIETPVGRFGLQPYFDEQTMNVAEGELNYWEGIMCVREGDLTGRQIGMGYMELAGYATRFSQNATAAQ